MTTVTDYVSRLPHINERTITIDTGRGCTRPFTNPTPASLNRLYRYLIDSNLKPGKVQIVNDGTARVVILS